MRSLDGFSVQSVGIMSTFTGTEWMKLSGRLVQAAASQPSVINNNQVERRSCAFMLRRTRAIILDLVREESITVRVLPDKELVLANLYSARHWSGFHIFWDKIKDCQTATCLKAAGPETSERVISEFPPRSYFSKQVIWASAAFSKSDFNAGEAHLQRVNAVTNRREQESLINGNLCNAKMEAVQQRCGEQVKCKLRLDGEDL